MSSKQAKLSWCNSVKTVLWLKKSTEQRTASSVGERDIHEIVLSILTCENMSTRWPSRLRTLRNLARSSSLPLAFVRLVPSYRPLPVNGASCQCHQKHETLKTKNVCTSNRICHSRIKIWLESRSKIEKQKKKHHPRLPFRRQERGTDGCSTCADPSWCWLTMSDCCSLWHSRLHSSLSECVYRIFWIQNNRRCHLRIQLKPYAEEQRKYIGIKSTTPRNETSSSIPNPVSKSGTVFLNTN